jgi:3-oxoacyl-[acyl-carrier-protein] synthase III
MVHPPAASIPRARVADIATYVPEGRLTNADLAKMVETSDEWIVQRTGIRERSIAAGNQFASDLCLEAVRRLRDRVGSLDRVDTVIAATSTADYVFPSLAAQIQYGAGLAHAGAFDVGAACAGFPYALNVASALVAAGQAREVLVVGGEVMTKALDYSDRSTCILFGDGAGAALVVPADERSYFERSTYGCDGEGGKYLYRTSLRHDIAGHEDDTGLLRQSGAEVYKWAVRRISQSILELLTAAELTANDIDWFVPHSANLRIVEALCTRTGIARERTLTSIETYGNTSTASIPLALMPTLDDGRVQRGDRILMYGFGGGLVHAGTLLRW